MVLRGGWTTALYSLCEAAYAAGNLSTALIKSLELNLTLGQAIERGDFAYALSFVLKYLQRAFYIYSHNADSYLFPVYPDKGNEEKPQFHSNLRGLLIYSLPQTKINGYIADFLREHAETCTGMRGLKSDDERQAFFRGTRQIVQRLQENGLGDSRLQRILAEVMNELFTKYIRETCAGNWTSPSRQVFNVHDWLESHFARFVADVLASSDHRTFSLEKVETVIAQTDIQDWKKMAITKIGALRIEELFSIIVDWENGSKGGVEDLQLYIATGPAARTHLTSSFSEVISRRLLQPAAATTEIIQIYISIIRAFSFLDPKGVLLDRVARPVRRYLRDRDDTVAIVVASLLADLEDSSIGTEIVVELAEEIENSTGLEGEEDGDDVDDWDDMGWTPDPVDAGPEYKKSKSLDIIGSLISLFETKDIFVKEFQNILGERLLKHEYDFEKEIRVLELLKLRFGESPLQACEVMLRDILDSRRVDTVIRNDQNLVMNSSDRPMANLHARILSHLFWPPLHSETFRIPSEIIALQIRYETGFATLKQSRELTWLNALGQVTVQLDLEDRIVTEEVQTWQASVIYAFQDHPGRMARDNDDDDDDDNDAPVTKTVAQLVDLLSMSESYVRNALTFWVGKLVLRSTSPDTYQVLETLSASATGAPSTLVAAAAAADAATAMPAAAVRSEEDTAREKMEVFWQFVLGMLTNQGPMPLARIVMMLKVVVPGGFPFGNEELKQYLEGRVKEGKLEIAGGNYRIVKGE